MPTSRPVALALVASLGLACGGAARTLYVSPAGNDTARGSLRSPLRTVTRAADLARPGTTILVRGGVYERSAIVIRARGSARAPITIGAFPGERPILDGGGAPAGSDVVELIGVQYVRLSGLEIRNGGRHGVNAWTSKHVVIAGNDIHHNQENGVYAGADDFGTASDITIEHNTVHDNVLANRAHALKRGGWKQAICVQLVSQALVAGNRVFDNDGEGIVFRQSVGGTARANDVYDDFSVGIYVDNSQAITVDGNFVHSTGNHRYDRDGQPSAGIGVANETGSANAASGLTITNNIVVGERWGFYYHNDSGGGMHYSTIANNTFYGATQALVWIDRDENGANVVESNVFAQPADRPAAAADGGAVAPRIADVRGGGFTFRRNLWFGGDPGAAAGEGDILADPRFTNAGGVTPSDYRLSPGSPALHAAARNPSVSRDYFGAARPDVTDLGAVQSAPPPAAGNSAR